MRLHRGESLKETPRAQKPNLPHHSSSSLPCLPSPSGRLPSPRQPLSPGSPGGEGMAAGRGQVLPAQKEQFEPSSTHLRTQHPYHHQKVRLPALLGPEQGLTLLWVASLLPWSQAARSPCCHSQRNSQGTPSWRGAESREEQEMKEWVHALGPILCPSLALSVLFQRQPTLSPVLPRTQLSNIFPLLIAFSLLWPPKIPHLLL